MLQASGTIRMSEINVELGRASDAEIGLKKGEDGNYGTINHSGGHNGSAPHTMSEWYSYFHMPNLVEPAGIIELWDARSSATSTDWDSIYGGDTQMSVAGAAYNTSTPKNFAFDGTNDYTVTGSTINLGDRWSIAIWLRHTATQGATYDRLFGMTDYQFDAAEDTTGKIRVYDGNWSIVDGVDLDDADWQHVVFTYNSAASAGESLKVYEAGDLADTSGDGRSVVSKTIYLGSQKNYGENWAGEIGQFILWGQALTSSQVTTLFGNDKGYFVE